MVRYRAKIACRGIPNVGPLSEHLKMKFRKRSLGTFVSLKALGTVEKVMNSKSRHVSGNF